LEHFCENKKGENFSIRVLPGESNPERIVIRESAFYPPINSLRNKGRISGRPGSPYCADRGVFRIGLVHGRVVGDMYSECINAHGYGYECTERAESGALEASWLMQSVSTAAVRHSGN